jgi:non-specific serine/threonine protein kinase
MFDIFYTPTHYISDLTPRERQVAELIARGYTNPQIAATLTITRETAKSHVSNILSKLGVSSRADVRLLMAGRRVE